MAHRICEDQLFLVSSHQQFCEIHDNYIEAAHKLIDYFGEINIIAFKNLKLIGDHNIIELASDREGADDLEQAEHVLDEYEKNFIW